MPLQPPTLPNFEKGKYAGGPWGALFAQFWQLIHPCLKATVEMLRRGVPTQALLDFQVQPGQTYPMPSLANPLPEGFAPVGLHVVHVFNPASPGVPVGLTGGVTVEWRLTASGELVVLSVTGLPANKRVTVRVLVVGGEPR